MQKGTEPNPRLFRSKGKLDEVHIENLTVAIGATGWARDVSRDAAFALRAGLELWLTPAVGSTAELLLMLGCATFRYCHDLGRLEEND